uniref:Sortilin-related receptor-like n=1 Tax=Maylandia zebra TaxID=106582 RepID=A0A3P9AR38_9CICH
MYLIACLPALRCGIHSSVCKLRNKHTSAVSERFKCTSVRFLLAVTPASFLSFLAALATKQLHERALKGEYASHRRNTLCARLHSALPHFERIEQTQSGMHSRNSFDMLSAGDLSWVFVAKHPFICVCRQVEYSVFQSADWTSARSKSETTKVYELRPETQYNFRVAAVTSRGVGNWSEVKSITPKKGTLVSGSLQFENLSFTLNSEYKVRASPQYTVILSWQFDTHVKENRNYTLLLSRVHLSGSVGVDVCCLFPATNLTAGTVYEVAVWAHTSVGDSPTTLTHQQTKGQQPERPLLKAKAVNQTAVECSWTVSGSPVYGVFYATSFLDFYLSPRQVRTPSVGLTVTVDSDEQFLFLVRVVAPFLGPPSDYAVVKMIPNEKLPPRNLHRVRVDKTQATLKWQPPYDSPSKPLTYAIHMRDVIRKVERDYKLTTQNNTVEYVLKGLEPGGRYSISVRLRNMSKEASATVLTGYEVRVFDSVTNKTSSLGNTTDTFFRISSLLVGHNYTFSVQARCLLNGQLCGEPAVLLYNQLIGTSDASRSEAHSGDTAAVVVPVLFLLLLAVCGGLVVLYLRHRRLQNNFTAFANSHYNSRLGSAIFSSGDELGDDDEDAPMISGFSDDVPMVIA